MLEDGGKEAKSFSVGYCHPGHELARTYAVNPTTRSHAQFYAKMRALTEATPELSALSESEFLSRYLKETSLKNLSRITVDTLAIIALLTDASYLKSLEDDIMQNNRLKDSPVDKHVEDEKKKKKAAK